MKSGIELIAEERQRQIASRMTLEKFLETANQTITRLAKENQELLNELKGVNKQRGINFHIACKAQHDNNELVKDKEMLLTELQRLRDLVGDEDVKSIDAILDAVK
jgi:hypothetical protein